VHSKDLLIVTMDGIAKKRIEMKGGNIYEAYESIETCGGLEPSGRDS
jgi:hypothetical protein